MQAVASHPVTHAMGNVAVAAGDLGTLGSVSRAGRVIGSIKGAYDALRGGGDTPDAPAPVAPTPAPKPAPSTLAQELLMREPDWRTVDAVPINALDAKGILEPGESRVGLAERAAMASKAGNAAEVEALLKALRQRMNISHKSGRP